VTRLLDAVHDGNSQAAEQLLPLVYDELRKLAAARMANESASHTLQPTALVHEAWLRLAGANARTPFTNRAHFFAAAAEAMRRILIERARAKATQKRGNNLTRISLENVDVASDANDETLLLVNDCLEKLAKENERAASIVKLRFFSGLTLEEASELLGVTQRTARRDWAFARAWLYDEIRSLLPP
jgi:RNA polymerase sigma factor (TIGR02999 family)